ncbi:MAG TPA: hypothetical protein DC001_07510 [Clostridiales bacterium]|nr:hypothetical protein [Clostridiales bacterium]HBR07955.1 hypothetical protein [Clostridiales bacterium]
MVGLGAKAGFAVRRTADIRRMDIAVIFSFNIHERAADAAGQLKQLRPRKLRHVGAQNIRVVEIVVLRHDETSFFPRIMLTE